MFRWLRRIGFLVSSMIAGVLIPAVAWAQTSPTVSAVSDDLARRKIGKGIGKGIGVLGVAGTLCCLAVVAIIVIVVLMIARRNRK